MPKFCSFKMLHTQGKHRLPCVQKNAFRCMLLFCFPDCFVNPFNLGFFLLVFHFHVSNLFFSISLMRLASPLPRSARIT